MVHCNLLRIAASLAMHLVPADIASQPDETMPDKIPDEILADWEEQGGTAADIEASLSR